MARTVLDLDEDALERARKALGTTTKVSTVNEALRRVAEEDARRQALTRELGRDYSHLDHRDALWR